MIDFTGIKCPVCGKAFAKDDDIVVCPQCGAPYHRDCYQKEGQCIFTGLHESGKEWKPPAPPPPPSPAPGEAVRPNPAEIKDRECPSCGALNSHSSLYCSRCGSPLLGQQDAPGQDRRPGETEQTPGQNTGPAYRSYNPYGAGGAPGQGPYGAPVFVYDPMGGVSPADTLESGVSFGDASRLVKQNTAYYMPVFRYMKQTRRNKFNFSAFLFSGAWMLYRKQYKYGIVVTALMFLIYLLYLAASIFVSGPALVALMAEAGIDASAGAGLTNEQLLVLSSLISEDPSLYLKLCLPMICLLLMLAVMIFVGVRGNKMYMRHCVEMVRRVKSADLKDYPDMTLDQKGGVNGSVAVCMFVCYFLLVNVVPLLL